ncbi:MAG: mechanosensitive ion channel family protein [Acidimicrobiia bacterium]
MEASITANLIRSGIVVVGAAVVYLLLVRLGRRAVARYAEKSEGESGARVLTLWKMMRRILLLAVGITTVLLLFGVWGFSVAPFLAVGTVLAAAVGFGAQDLVKDVIAGFFMLIEDQFHIGDTVTMAGATGAVEDIQLRVTVLRDLEGNLIFVPNGQVTVTSNYTSHYARPVIDVGIAYEADVDLALAVFEEELNALASDPEWADRIDGPCEIMGVNELGDSAVVLRARLVTAADERWTVRREALRRVKLRFDAEGISIPFPQLRIHQEG